MLVSRHDGDTAYSVLDAGCWTRRGRRGAGCWRTMPGGPGWKGGSRSRSGAGLGGPPKKKQCKADIQPRGWQQSRDGWRARMGEANAVVWVVWTRCGDLGPVLWPSGRGSWRIGCWGGEWVVRVLVAAQEGSSWVGEEWAAGMRPCKADAGRRGVTFMYLQLQQDGLERDTRGSRRGRGGAARGVGVPRWCRGREMGEQKKQASQVQGRVGGRS